MKIEDSVLLGDGLQVDGNGYLRVNARTARTGIQAYLGSEVGRPDLEMVNVYRDEREVFSKRSLDTFANIPITVGHPDTGVKAGNWRDEAVGNTLEEVLRDGEYLKIGLKIMDSKAVELVKAGRRELSVGYETELVWGDGVAPDGTPYQARQTKIVADHIAIVSRGRAGSQARIGDDADNGGKDRATWGATPLTFDRKDVPMADAVKTRTVLIDGLSVETTDAGAQALEKLTKDLAASAAKFDTAAADHTKALAAKDEEIGTLKAELQKAKDAAPKPADLDKLVADRAVLVTAVKAIDAKIEVSGKSDADLRKAAVAAKLGDEMVKDASEAEVAGMFKAIAKDVKPADPFREAVKDGIKQTGDAAANATQAWDKSVADLNAWRKEA